jgi:hypothetical protein
MVQVMNPLNYHCAPNEATPDCVAAATFRDFVAYGLWECWLGQDPEHPGGDTTFPWGDADVAELRSAFLGLLESIIVALWDGSYKPGDGDIDGDWKHVSPATPGDEESREATDLCWYVRLDADAIMFELCCTGSDAVAIWLSYESLRDRSSVLKVLEEAEDTVNNKVWNVLVTAANQWASQRRAERLKAAYGRRQVSFHMWVTQAALNAKHPLHADASDYVAERAAVAAERRLENMVDDAAKGIFDALKTHTGFVAGDGERERACEFLYDLFGRYRTHFAKKDGT